jgi:hypothetical protein
LLVWCPRLHQPPLPTAFPSPSGCRSLGHVALTTFGVLRGGPTTQPAPLPTSLALIGLLLSVPSENESSPPGVTPWSSVPCRPQTPWYGGWMRNAFAPIVRARPCPTFGRPVRLRGGPHRLRPGTSPHALRIPPHGGHPALRVTRAGSRSPLAVSGFRLRARLGFSIPSSPRPARNYPRFRIRRPSSGRRRDFNPPDHHAAQRTL